MLCFAFVPFAHAQRELDTSKAGTCVLEVDDRLVHVGACRITASATSLTIRPARSPAPFAIVNADANDPSAGLGYWSGPEQGSTHAHDPLGDMRRCGACWIGKMGKVCAWAR
jgi:hypothetical protein